MSPNITPFRLKDWTDAEIYRAITSGVSKDGHPLFPIMPYPAYGTLDSEDIYSVIAYIRSIPSIDYAPSRSNPSFPMNTHSDMENTWCGLPAVLNAILPLNTDKL